MFPFWKKGNFHTVIIFEMTGIDIKFGIPFLGYNKYGFLEESSSVYMNWLLIPMKGSD